jgi:hypothetical protein
MMSGSSMLNVREKCGHNEQDVTGGRFSVLAYVNRSIRSAVLCYV